MSLRDEKKSATRLTLQQAATTLAMQRPWAQVSIDDIVELAGVSRRTFFNYFTSKEEVLISENDDRSEEIIAAIKARPEGESAWQVLRAGVLGRIGDADPEAMRLIVEIRRQPEFVIRSFTIRTYLEQALSEEIERRNPRWSAGDALMCVALFLTATRVAGANWLADPGGVTLAQALDKALDTVAFRPSGLD